MSLNLPDLDDRTYAEIIDDARKRIPVYTEQWTDHNASDPGITVLELLAWLAETYTYQLDRITDEHRLKYLALLGERPRPPKPARADLKLRLPEGVMSGTVTRSTKLVATDDTDTTYGFETVRETNLTAATLGEVITDGDRGRLDHRTANETPGMHFAAFDETAVEGSALYLGFEGDPFFGSKTLSLTVRLYEADLPKPATHGETADSWTEPDEFRPSVEVEWQHCIDYDAWHHNSSWVKLAAEDGTNQFYQSGRVTLTRPGKGDPQWVKTGGTLFGRERPYRWLRCVVKNGGYEIVPRVDSIEVNIVPVEHRWTVDPDRIEEPVPLEDADRNTESTGLPHQRFRFTSPFTPDGAVGDDRLVTLLDDEDTLEVLVGDVPWERQDDFDTSGPHDTHYVLDYDRGEVVFGDGSRGKLPPAEASITARRYVIGGGTAGNLPAGVTWSFEEVVRLRNRRHAVKAGDVGYPTITQPEPATGGVDAESIDEAFDRLQEDRLEPYRAVSLADYEYLATHTPGLRFGRAAARLVTTEPVEQTPLVDTPGCGHGTDGDVEGDTDTSQLSGGAQSNEYCEPHHEVRLVVVPYSRSARPTPSEAFVDAVQRHLDRHRLLTDRVTVEYDQPTYVAVSVQAEVRLEPEFDSSDRAAAIVDALETFIHPLYGFEGDGWPFGRTLYRSELYEVIESVAGVDCVTQLDVRRSSDGGADAGGNIDIEETELLTSGEHRITTQSAARGAQCEEEW